MFISNVRELGAKLEKDEDTIMERIISGLRPRIKSYVLSQAPADLNAAMQHARMGQSLYPDDDEISMLQMLQSMNIADNKLHLNVHILCNVYAKQVVSF